MDSLLGIVEPSWKVELHPLVVELSTGNSLIVPRSESVMFSSDKPYSELLRAGTVMIVAWDDQLIWHDMATGIERPLGRWKNDWYARLVRRAGRFVWINPLVIDLPSGTVLGRVDTQVMALSSTGHALVGPALTADAPIDQRNGAVLGPLRWQWPYQ